jgi:transposase
MPNHPAPPLVISEREQAELRLLSRAGTTEQRLAMRARVVLRAAAGVANERIADDLGVHKMTVLLWRGRFERDRLAGLSDAPRPGRQPAYDRAARDRVIALTLSEPPDGTTHWSTRRLAREVGMSETTVWRIWRSAGLEAPPARDVQVEHRSGARGEGARRGGPLSRPAGAGDRVERRREDADLRPSTGPSPGCRCGRDRSRATPTTTSATARRACSRRSTSSPAR